MQEVREGMKITLAMPEVWLAGVSGFFIYFAYTSLPYYVTYLDESYALPALAASIFAILSTSVGRISSAFVAGFVTNRLFWELSRWDADRPRSHRCTGNSARTDANDTVTRLGGNGSTDASGIYHFLHARALLRTVWRDGATPTIFGIGDRCSRFCGLRALVLWLLSLGLLLDNFPGDTGYRYLFTTLAVIGVSGAVAAIFLRRRMGEGLRDRIARKVAVLDEKLGLEGEEKTFAQL